MVTDPFFLHKPRLFDPPRIGHLKVCGIEIVGMSIGGIRTSLALKEFGICFDVAQGWPFHLNIKNFFITHGHLDHSAGIPYIISQKNLNGIKDTVFHLPKELTEPIENIMNIWKSIENHEYSYNLKGLNPDDRVPLDAQHFVVPFRTYHRVSSLGYTLFRQQKKLNPKYKMLIQSEIVQLKKSGIEIEVKSDIPLFTFSGDTMIEFVFEKDWIKESKVLAIEVTYIDEKKPVSAARQWGHIHLDELIEVLPQLNNEKIILIHLSSRYKQEELQILLNRKLSTSDQERVVIFPS